MSLQAALSHIQQSIISVTLSLGPELSPNLRTGYVSSYILQRKMKREDCPGHGLGKRNDMEENMLGVQLAEMRETDSVSIRDQSLFRLNRNCFITES